MSRRRTIVVLTAAAGVLALALAGAAVAHGTRGMHDPAHVARFVTERVNALLDDVKASDAQRARILAVKERLLAEAQAQMSAHQAVHETLREAWNADTVDAAKLHALVDARIDEFRTVAHHMIDGMTEVHDTLTPAQRAQVAAEFDRHHGHP
jgi:periplasmic protein CpxP/Spy